MESLKKESHPFAKQCLEAMGRNSMLSMKLTLKMMRNAINMDYEQCLRMELNVAFNKIQDKDFDLGVAEVLMKPKSKNAAYKTAPAWDKNVKESDLVRYFDPSKWSEQVNLGIVENALLPTRHFYERFTDQVRLWLNEESSTNEMIRKEFDIAAKESLKEQGIDVRDKALTPRTARDHLRAKLAKEHVEEVFDHRSTQLMTDLTLRGEYFGKIKE